VLFKIFPDSAKYRIIKFDMGDDEGEAYANLREQAASVLWHESGLRLSHFETILWGETVEVVDDASLSVALQESFAVGEKLKLVAFALEPQCKFFPIFPSICKTNDGSRDSELLSQQHLMQGVKNVDLVWLIEEDSGKRQNALLPGTYLRLKESDLSKSRYLFANLHVHTRLLEPT